MRYSTVEKTDSVHTGRSILIGIGAFYLLLWIFTFVCDPVILIPAFLYDRTLQTLGRVAGFFLQLTFLGIFLSLVWAGIGWARFVLGSLFLLAGTIDIIVSMLIGADGAGALLLGVVSLVSAGALVLSSAVEKYTIDRRARGIPVVSLCIWALVFLLAAGAVIGIDSLEVWQIKRVAADENRFASTTLEKFARTLDSEIIASVATTGMKNDMYQSDAKTVFQGISDQLGPFRNFTPAPSPSLKALVFNPHLTDHFAYFARATYEKGSLELDVSVNTSPDGWQLSDLNYRTELTPDPPTPPPARK